MSTAIHEINVQTNGLGTIIKVDATPPAGSNQRKYAYYRKVYFSPDDGAYIKNIKLTYTTTSNSSGSNVTSEPTVTYSQLDPQTRNVEDMNLYGSHYIGIEYSQTFPDTAGIPTYYKTTNDYEITGTANQLSLGVVGGGVSAFQMHFPYGYFSNIENNNDTPDGIYTLVCRYTETAETYTNLVGYNGSDVVFTSGINDSVNVSDDCIHPSTTAFQEIPFTSYETCYLHAKVYTTQPVSQFKLYSNCRLCVFSLGTEPCEEIAFRDSYSNFKLKVRSMFMSAANALKTGNPDLKNLYAGYINIPNGCLSVMVDGEKKYLYPDKKVYDYLYTEMLIDRDEPRLATMVGEHSNTIPEDLRWVETLKDGFGNQISRYTHVVKLVRNDDQVKIQDVAEAESSYARFTGYWYVHGKYWNTTKKSVYGRMKYSCKDKNLPTSDGNVVLHPVFKPFAESDLTIFQEDDAAFTPKYANFFNEKLDFLYKNEGDDNKGEGYRKKWYVNARGPYHTTKNKIRDWAKTVSPYKNLILAAHGMRTEDNSGDGSTAIQVSSESAITIGVIQKAVQKCKYWWDDDFWTHKLSLGMFIASCYGCGFQNEQTRPDRNNCVIHDTKKIIPDLDNMFYIIGATASHYNFGGDVQLELPVMEVALCHKYSLFCSQLNNIVNNFKTEVFGEITKFYVNYYDDMTKCLRSSEDEEIWDRTYETILDDLKNCGRRYFCIPYYEPENPLRNSPNTWIRLDGEGDGEVEELNHYVHDGFVGLLRKEVFKEDGPQKEHNWKGNLKKFFVELTDEDTLGHMLYDKALKRVKDGLSNLGDCIDSKVINTFGNSYPDWIRLIALTEPVCGCSGDYRTSEALFMANPNEDYDEWLSVDQELGIIENKTKDWIFWGVD